MPLNHTLNYSQPTQSNELITPALHWLKANKRVALATLINIEGSAPYPVGSQMLVNDSGEYLGQITGGCAERAIADQAVLAIQNKENKTVRYGLDSPFFDIQLPCGSGIDVYFDCDLGKDYVCSILNHLKARNSFTQTITSPKHSVSKTYLPCTRLILFGQGPILVSLAELAIRSGFEVACIAQNEHSKLLVANAGLAVNNLEEVQDDFACELDQYTAMVSLFHEHDLETNLLVSALKTDAFYIGALGSKRTHATRLKSLRNLNIDCLLLDRINGPVGLDINAETPAQIAVSILAEIIQQMNKHRG